MQFIYRLGAVILGATVFVVTFAATDFAWIASSITYVPAVSWGYLMGYSVPMLIPAALAAWGVVRVWRWVCAQDKPRRTPPRPRCSTMGTPEEAREPKLFPERPITITEWTEY